MPVSTGARPATNLEWPEAVTPLCRFQVGSVARGGKVSFVVGGLYAMESDGGKS